MTLRDRLEYLAFRTGGALLRALPLGAAQAIAGFGARCLFALRGKGVRHTLVNLRLAYPELPEDARLEIGRRSFEHFAWNAVDFLRAQRWSDADVRERVSLEGLDHVEKALDRGKGVFVLSLHLGNFELGSRAFGIGLGSRMAVVGRPLRNPLLFRELESSRGRSGAENIDRRSGGLAMLRALRQGKAVAVLLDQYSRRTRGVFVPLFGYRCSTSAGVATLALRAGAAIVPAYIVRDAPDHHTVTFLPELSMPASGDRKRDIEAGTARMNEALESLIRKHPEQWMWAHRRFRHSPDLPPDLY